MPYLARLLEASLRKALTTFPAVYVGGPRQAGKTTLLRKALGKRFHYVNFEDPSLRERFSKDPKAFLDRLGRPALFDEVQYVPALFSHLKARIDEDRKPGQWALTGSQALPLMQGLSQSLAGRVAVLTLLPLGAPEAWPSRGPETLEQLLEPRERPRPRSASLESWILRGAYPEPRVDPRVDRQTWMASYIQTYLERDVRTLLKVGDLNDFERFLRLCAARTGQTLKLAELARDCGISFPTAKNWLSVLEASHEVFLLQPFFENFGKRLIKAPKLYFLDSGLAAFLMDIHSPEGLMQGPVAGALFETAVVSGWRKAFLHRGLLPSLYSWHASDGLSVDLVIQWNGRLHPVEVKLSSDPVPGHAAAMKKWMGLAKRSSTKGILMHGGDRFLNVDKDVLGVPWWVV